METENLASAKEMIEACEYDLGRRLSDGECRDLLKDNTDWDNDEVAALVATIRKGTVVA